MSDLRPDTLARGLTTQRLDPLRYGCYPDDPREAPGMIARMLPESGRVLDVGCGTGATLELVALHRELELVGLEPQPERAAAARERGFEVYERELSEKVRDDLGEFDAILFVDVLEHLADPVALLDLAGLLLRPGGLVFASLPNVAHWTVRLNLMRGRFDYTAEGILDATHLRFFTEAGVRRLFEAAGYELHSLCASAGVGGMEYRETAPFKFLKKRHRAPLVRFASRRWPRLFGYQYVVSGRPRAAPCDSAQRDRA